MIISGMKARIWMVAWVAVFVGFGQGRAQLWEPLGGGLRTYVQSIFADTSTGKLYLAGQSKYAGDSLVNGLAVWDGASFTSVGGGLPNASYCLPSDDYICSAPGGIQSWGRNVFVGGSFHTNIAILPFQGLARWDGIRWRDCGPHDDQLYFDEANGQLFGFGMIHDGSTSTVQSFGRWNGAAFERFGPPITFYSIGDGPYGVEYFQGQYYFGGNFQEPNGLRDIMYTDGSQWLPLHQGILGDGAAMSMKVFKDQLFVGGPFYAADGNPSDNIMAWDGSHWYNPFPRVMYTRQVNSMEVIGGSLYIVGDHYIQGDNGWEGPFGLAKYDGQSFCAFGGLNIYPSRVAGYGNEIFVTGGMTIALPDSSRPTCDTIRYLGHWLGGDSVDFCVSQPVHIIAPASPEAALVSLYPNPTSSTFSLTLPPNATTPQIQIRDPQGRAVAPLQAYTGTPVDVSALARGLYFVEVSWRGGKTVLKLLKA